MKEKDVSGHKLRDIDITKIDIDRIIYLVENLTKSLKNESEILSKMNVKLFTDIYQNKVEMMQEFEIHQQIFEQRPELIKSVNSAKLLKLKKLYIPFEEAQKVNKKKLERAISMNKHVINLIKELVTENIQSKSGYGKNGSYASNAKIEQDMPAFNLNSVI